MARAVTKYVRMSPRKVRRVVNEIRGKSAKEAQILLKFMTFAAASVVSKTLQSAIANAKENENLNPDNLKITTAFVDQSVTLKRWRPMSRGRAFPILKKSSHITIEVNEGEAGTAGEKTVEAIAKKAAAKTKTSKVEKTDIASIDKSLKTSDDTKKKTKLDKDDKKKDSKSKSTAKKKDSGKEKK